MFPSGLAGPVLLMDPVLKVSFSPIGTPVEAVLRAPVGSVLPVLSKSLVRPVCTTSYIMFYRHIAIDPASTYCDNIHICVRM